MIEVGETWTAKNTGTECTDWQWQFKIVAEAKHNGRRVLLGAKVGRRGAFLVDDGQAFWFHESGKTVYQDPSDMFNFVLMERISPD